MTRFIVEARGIWKTYPGGITANRDVSVVFRSGEVAALLGENGAGKTTLVSIIAGLVKPDKGYVVVNGRRLPPGKPRDALRAGIVLVPQHPRLVDTYTVAENIGLALYAAGKPRGMKEVYSLVEEIARNYGLDIDPGTEIYRLSMGEKQRVEIIKALAVDAKLIMLDEPSTHLTPHEVKSLIALTRRLAEEGRAVVYITHRIHEALNASDRIIVMRNGRVVASLPRDKASEDKLLEYIFGERLREVESTSTVPIQATRAVNGQGKALSVEDLWVKGLRGGIAVRGVSFSVGYGEVVGIAGVAGNGQRELFEAIIGIRRPLRGRILITGIDVTWASPRRRLLAGLGIVPEERIGWGIVPRKSLVFNAILGKAVVDGKLLLDWGYARKYTEEIIKYMQVDAASLDADTDTLSGGNMQRFIIGRELLKNPRILVAMNPTSGLDLVAARRVRRELVGLARRGAGVLVFSEDLDELVEISDRILVMSRGVFRGEYSRPFNAATIAKAMTS